MSEGLRLFADGGLDPIIDTSTKTGRVLGIIVNSSGTGGGTITDPRLADGTPWATIVFDPQLGYVFSPINGLPTGGDVSFSGTNMTYGVAGSRPFKVIYGVS